MTATAFATTLLDDEVQEIRMVLGMVADKAIKAPGAAVEFSNETEGQGFHEVLDTFLDMFLDAELDYTNYSAINFATDVEGNMSLMWSAEGQHNFLMDCRTYYHANV